MRPDKLAYNHQFLNVTRRFRPYHPHLPKNIFKPWRICVHCTSPITCNARLFKIQQKSILLAANGTQLKIISKREILRDL